MGYVNCKNTKYVILKRDEIIIDGEKLNRVLAIMPVRYQLW